jgi:cysteine synthase A
MKIAENMTKLTGNTPLVWLNRIALEGDAKIAAKLEFFNPASSVKDRIGMNMLKTAEREGKLKSGSKIVEPTSGNTGIALAWVSAVKGYKLILTMPESMSIERRKLLELLGAEIVLTPAQKGMKGAVEKAEQIANKSDDIFMPQQFRNPANPQIHRETTAEEIWKDTEGQVDIFIAGIGTGGTITGVGEILKSRKQSIQVIGIEPQTSAILSGKQPGAHKIQGIGAGFVPEILNRDIIDEVLQIKDSKAMNTAKQLAEKEGILAGISSGAAAAAAVEISQRPKNKNKLIVTLLCDTAERYLSTTMFE